MQGLDGVQRVQASSTSEGVMWNTHAVFGRRLLQSAKPIDSTAAGIR